MVSREAERVLDLRALLPGDYYCAGCAGRVCEAVAALVGVSDVGCDLDEGVLTVSYGQKAFSAAEIEAQVVRLALEETGQVGHAVYRLTGLD